MFENPSAGKFDPPPGADRFEPPRPPRKGVWILFALGTGLVILQETVSWLRPRGAWALTGFGLMAVLWVLQFVARRKLQPEEDEPYSKQQHVTR